MALRTAQIVLDPGSRERPSSADPPGGGTHGCRGNRGLHLPDRETYRTTPAGIELLGPAPPRRARTRAQDRAARVRRARNRNRVERKINTAARELEDARRDEITARKFRNHMRDMLALFKGAPSTGPFCTWVNDPREPEELPPDWRPPPLPALPDDPPF